MTDGIRINYGETLGKTIIFAKNHDHAEKILEIFGKEYPNLPGYAKVIDQLYDLCYRVPLMNFPNPTNFRRLPFP